MKEAAYDSSSTLNHLNLAFKLSLLPAHIAAEDSEIENNKRFLCKILTLFENNFSRLLHSLHALTHTK
jgi:hypothetical protein